MAAAAVWEVSVIGQRTREALAARRAAGVRLGRPPRGIDPVSLRITNMRAKGATLQRIADALNAESVPTYRGGTQWRPSSIRAVLNRVGE